MGKWDKQFHISGHDTITAILLYIICTFMTIDSEFWHNNKLLNEFNRTKHNILQKSTFLFLT